MAEQDAGAGSGSGGSGGGGDSPAMKALKAAQAAIAQAKTNQAAPPPDDSQASVEAAMAEAAAQAAAQAAAPPTPPASQRSQAAPMTIPTFSAGTEAKSPEGIDLLSDVNLHVKIELGRTKMLVEDVLRLTEGSVVELDKLAGDPVDVYVNDRPVARGEVLVLNDNFCVRISEIVGSPGASA